MYVTLVAKDMLAFCDVMPGNTRRESPTQQGVRARHDICPNLYFSIFPQIWKFTTEIAFLDLYSKNLNNIQMFVFLVLTLYFTLN